MLHSAAKRLTAAAITVSLLTLVGGCTVAPPKPPSNSAATAAVGSVNGRTPLVKPGELDTELAFFSGGPMGNVWVVGIPSMRILRSIPVFEAEAAYGYGYNPETRQMLQSTMPDASSPSWGDTHHPMLSKTNGDYDGKFLYIQDLANSRVAKIDMSTFKTAKITRLPNVQGVHGIGVDPNTKYVWATGEYEIPNGLNPNANQDHKYQTAVTMMDSDLNVLAQVPMPYGNTDIMGTSFDGHYVFTTIYNTEDATDIMGMVKNDEDAAAFIDVHKVEAALKEGKYTTVNGVKMVDPKYPGLLNLVPVPKNPHGIDPDPTGKYVLVSDKLSPTVSIIDLSTLKVVAQPEVGTGPLHTAFDGRGNAYTSLFLDSAIVKWNIADAVAGKPKNVYIKDVEQTNYSPGHVGVDGSGSEHPIGQWLIAPNKFSHDRFVNVGADFPVNEQLFDISGDKMKLVADMPMIPEPHDVVMVPASLFKNTVQGYSQQAAMPGMNMPGSVNMPMQHMDDPNMKATPEGGTKIVRDGNKVTVWTTAKRSEFGFKELDLKKGDEVTIYITSLETESDIIHGFAIADYGINVPIASGETVKVQFTADKAGTFWAYCTWFCSAMHKEMRSQIIVSP